MAFFMVPTFKGSPKNDRLNYLGIPTNYCLN
jgi:hypothetical protein